MSPKQYEVNLRWSGGEDVFLQYADATAAKKLMKALTIYKNDSRMSTPLREGWTVVVIDPQTNKEVSLPDLL